MEEQAYRVVAAEIVKGWLEAGCQLEDMVAGFEFGIGDVDFARKELGEDCDFNALRKACEREASDRLNG